MYYFSLAALAKPNRNFELRLFLFQTNAFCGMGLLRKLIVFGGKENAPGWDLLLQTPKCICLSNYFGGTMSPPGAGPGVLIPPWAAQVLPQAPWEIFTGKVPSRTEIINGTRGLRSRRNRKNMENKVLLLLDLKSCCLVPGSSSRKELEQVYLWFWL